MTIFFITSKNQPKNNSACDTLLVAGALISTREKSNKSNCGTEKTWTDLQLLYDFSHQRSSSTWYFSMRMGKSHKSAFLEGWSVITNLSKSTKYLNIANISKWYQNVAEGIKVLDDFLSDSVQHQILTRLSTTTQSFRAATYHILKIPCPCEFLLFSKLQEALSGR